MDSHKCGRCAHQEYIPSWRFILLRRAKEKTSEDRLSSQGYVLGEKRQVYLCTQCYVSINEFLFSSGPIEDEEQRSCRYKGEYHPPLIRQRPIEPSDIGGVLIHPIDGKAAELNKNAFSRLERFLNVGNNCSGFPQIT